MKILIKNILLSIPVLLAAAMLMEFKSFWLPAIVFTISNIVLDLVDCSNQGKYIIIYTFDNSKQVFYVNDNVKLSLSADEKDAHIFSSFDKAAAIINIYRVGVDIDRFKIIKIK